MPDVHHDRWFTLFKISSVVFLLLGLVLIPLHSLLRPWPQAAEFSLGLGFAFIFYAITALLVGFKFGIFSKSAEDGTVENTEDDPDVARTWDTVLGFLLVGILAIVIFAASVATPPLFWKEFAKAASAGVLIGIAFLSIGGLFGFLFGIPRSLRRMEKEKNEGQPGTIQGGALTNPQQSNEIDPEPSRYDPNTNLEEISDWLTKIIVGLGLINLEKVPGYLMRLSEFFAENCGLNSCRSVILAIIIFFFIGGFFLCYLLTRLYLGGAFTPGGYGCEARQKVSYQLFSGNHLHQ